jgi:dienelactone hydrolase
MKPDMGIYYPMLDALAAKPPSLSFLSEEWTNVEAWRATGRAKVFNLLEFDPPDFPLSPKVESRVEDEVITEEVSYQMPYGPRTHAFFLYPTTRPAKLPAVVALHDHGEFFFYGKEKIANSPIEPTILQEYKQHYYGGRSWATELAKRGFAVLAPDVFLWGSRRIPQHSVNEDLQRSLIGLDESSEEYARRYNEFWSSSECPLVVDSILNSGANWPGIFAYEDRRSVDYLQTRPEVDQTRIGCGGLSMGGLRTIFLGALDPRVKATFCVGFMTTMRSILRNKVRCPPGHGLLMYVPHLYSYLDLPDVMGLHAPAPLMVQYNEEDELFTTEGQHEADRKIAMIYSKAGKPDNYAGRFYSGQHKFDIPMQNEVFDWLEKELAEDAPAA